MQALCTCLLRPAVGAQQHLDMTHVKPLYLLKLWCRQPRCKHHSVAYAKRVQSCDICIAAAPGLRIVP